MKANDYINGKPNNKCHDRILDANVNATTDNYDKVNKRVTTVFDSRKYGASTDLAIVRTILHEGVHAYLVTYFANDPINANKDYAAMVDQWTNTNKADLNDIHHDEFVRDFISKIGDALNNYGDMKDYTFDSENEKKQFYSDLAWGGLIDTQAFKNLSPADRKRINDTISAEQYGIDSDGNPKLGKGTNGGC